MAKVQTHELRGVAIDWLIAQMLSVNVVVDGSELREAPAQFSEERIYSPSESVEQGAGLILSAGISTRFNRGFWYAMSEDDCGSGERVQWNEFTFRGGAQYGTLSYEVHNRRQRFSGSSFLEAGLRCYLAMKCGAEVEVPDEILRLLDRDGSAARKTERSCHG